MTSKHTTFTYIESSNGLEGGDALFEWHKGLAADIRGE